MEQRDRMIRFDEMQSVGTLRGDWLCIGEATPDEPPCRNPMVGRHPLAHDGKLYALPVCDREDHQANGNHAAEQWAMTNQGRQVWTILEEAHTRGREDGKNFHY